ncbi:hypothetical protein SS7213T_04390, partial [Staphylococcus simiae CCM 7213 = CCUG 51256]
EKVRVKGYMFTDERYKAFFEYVMDVGKVLKKEYPNIEVVA